MLSKTLPTLFLQALLVAGASALAIVAVTRFVSPIPLSISQVTTNKSSAFSATGKSVVTTIPDKVEVTLGISRKEKDIKQAQSRANEIINTIQAELVKLGIKKEDIKTQNYSIYPNYDYQNGGQNLLGYSVDINLVVSLTDFEKLNQVVDTATANGANQVGGVQFKLSDEKERQVREEARAQAIEDAKKNGQELARLAGMKLGKVINVTEGQQPQDVPMMMAEKGIGGGAGGPTNIQPGSTTYTYTVTVSYETL